MNPKKEIQLVAFDLDGTIYNGSQLIHGSIETINFFRNLGKKICFFTNNSSQSRNQIFNKLKGFSIELLESEIYNCAYAINVYLRSESYKNIYVIGSKELINEVLNSGINIASGIEDIKIDALLIGMDIEFNFTKLAKAYEVLQRNENCKILVCNMDFNFPVENGLRKPGCGAIVSSVLAASGKGIDFLIGKPNTYILNLIGKENEVQYDKMLVIGDSVESDIQMARNSNAYSILIDDSGMKNAGETLSVSNLTEINSIFNLNFI